MRALGILASKNQDRVSYDMTFTFTSDQDENWNHVIHLDQNNWFNLQSVQVIKKLYITFFNEYRIKNIEYRIKNIAYRMMNDE